MASLQHALGLTATLGGGRTLLLRAEQCGLLGREHLALRLTLGDDGTHEPLYSTSPANVMCAAIL